MIAFTGPARAAGDLARPDVSILLVRDPVVQAELKLNERQRGAVDRSLEELDALVFALRDDRSVAAGRKLTQELRKTERRLNAALSEAQYRRLQNIVLRAQGYQALFEVATARRLKVSEQQQADIRKILGESHRELAELHTLADNDSNGFIEQAVKRVEDEREQNVHAVLTAEQQKQWANLRGAPFDFDGVKPAAPRAPELAGINAWINSEPLTMAGLRGKVVVVHFWTFGDKHCVNNYPWYREWHARYAGLGFVVIGVHTAEFPNEQDVDAITAEARIHKLEFPIAVDNSAETWSAWTNPTWPAAYLVDRRGCVRLWWYGELSHPDTNAGQVMQDQIEELLTEK
jgi:hypothetical protein